MAGRGLQMRPMNNMYGDSPGAAMPKYGVCCLTSYMATNEACPNMGNGHSGRSVALDNWVSIFGHTVSAVRLVC